MYRFTSLRLSRKYLNFHNIAITINNNCTKLKKTRTPATDRAIVRSLSFERRSYSDIIRYSEEVEDARARNLPIVALESTIITHGMPYPDNLATAIRVEDIIREKGVVPATIAIVDGKIHVGLCNDRLEKLARCATGGNDEKHAMRTRTTKCSRRDIARLISERANGGTTVGGTMTIARMAGIPIMATGGIGGVHRGAENTLDVSSDLTELGRNPVAVVCAGVKAILDIPKTLEYLETQGVPVVTIGKTDNFPAFYCRSTSSSAPLKSPLRVSDPQAAAMLLRAQERLGLENGVLFAVAIPESDALEPEIVESCISDALAAADADGIRGKDVTPYLLKELNRLSSGGFLKANQALVENNASVAAEMALALNNLRRNDNEGSSSSTIEESPTQQPSRRSRDPGTPVVIGGATEDTILHTNHPSITPDGRTHHVKTRRASHGGVGRNVAAAMIALGLDNTRLVSVVGNDAAGRSILEGLGDAGKTVQVLADVVTPRYTAILNQNGECRLGIAEMDAFDAIGTDLIAKRRATLERAGLIVLDGNLPRETMRACVQVAAENRIPVWYEPTDIAKACKIFEASSEWIDFSGSDNVEDSSVVRFISPNVNELLAIAKYLNIFSPSDERIFHRNNFIDEKDDYMLKRITEMSEGVARVVPVVITTLGSRGILVTRRGSSLDPLFDPTGRTSRMNQKLESRWYSAIPVEKRNPEDKFSVSGCGDCLAAGIITASFNGLGEKDCVRFALEAAALSLKSYEPVPSSLRELRKYFVAKTSVRRISK